MGRVGDALHIAPFYFSNFLELLDEKYQKLELPFLVLTKVSESDFVSNYL